MGLRGAQACGSVCGGVVINMNTERILSHMSEECRKRGVALLLVGGWALSHYGVSRHTVDIDFLTGDESREAMDEILAGVDYERVFRHELFARYRCRDKGWLDVDVLFVEPGTLKEMVGRSQWTRIGGAEFRAPRVEDMIAMKLHGLKYGGPGRWRRDFPDILGLIEANGVDARGREFETLCGEFGPEGIRDRIVRELKGEGEAG